MDKLNLLKECEGAKTIGIGGHIRPDGDCVGSCLALWMYLTKACPEAVTEVFIEQPADVFGCIRGVDQIRSDFPEREPFDVFFALDCVPDRMGGAEQYFHAAKKTINIDHHISNANGSGMVNYVEPKASATSELIYELAEKEYLDADIAKAIYIGIIHDCGVFQYSNTSPRTLRIAADLISYGFDFTSIIDETFYERTYVQSQVMSEALLKSRLFMDGKCIVTSVDREMMEAYGVGPKDLDGIVNQLRIIRGVECAIFLYQTGEAEYKVSMRSNRYVDVSAVATCFGGGGHVRAAGCTMNGEVSEIIEQLSQQIRKQIVA